MLFTMTIIYHHESYFGYSFCLLVQLWLGIGSAVEIASSNKIFKMNEVFNFECQSIFIPNLKQILVKLLQITPFTDQWFNEWNKKNSKCELSNFTLVELFHTRE